jgi:uncharacterized membrane protein YraQ (UPF0718 family)
MYCPRFHLVSKIDMEQFPQLILESLKTTGLLIWYTLWAFILGYMLSAAIQTLVTREQMSRVLGSKGVKQMSLASFFGFISSSCSFASLAATRSVMVKGAHPKNAIAFLIATTNLVIETGIVLWLLVGWKFVVANFALGDNYDHLRLLTLWLFYFRKNSRQWKGTCRKAGGPGTKTPFT